MTNRQFAEQDKLFRKACELAQLPETARQAGKWLNGKGLALRFKADAQRALKEAEEEKANNPLAISAGATAQPNE